MISLAPKPRVLRLSGFHLLSVPRVKIHADTRAFSVAIPTLWNPLPEHLKTPLFRLAYRPLMRNV